MSSIEKDFDRLALFDSGGWTANNHYHDFLLRNLNSECVHALEIGCGTGAFSRKLAKRATQVTAIDLSSEMIRVARSRSTDFANIQFEVADVMARDLPETYFDCIVTIATLHHLPMRAALLKLKQTLKPGGTLIVLDLYEPERNILTLRGLEDSFLNLVAMGTSCTLRLLYNGRLRPPPEVRAAWEEHGKSDSYLTMSEVRSLYASVFFGVVVRQKQSSVILVCARSRLQPDLRGTARRFRIGSGSYHLQLFHQVGTDVGGVLALEVVTDAVSRIVDHNAVPAEIDGADALAVEQPIGRLEDALPHSRPIL